MKKRIIGIIFICMLAVFMACGSKGDSSFDGSRVEDGIFNDEECFILIVDGETNYNISVEAYGDEVELPEPKGASDGGEFIGWLSHTGLFAPGDMVVSEEFGGYEAVYTSPNAGTFLILDSMGNGYSQSSSEEGTFTVENPYTNDYSFNNYDYYIDYYVDNEGQRYGFDETVQIGHGEYLVLTTVYSEDLGGAYKVSISYNPPGDSLFDESSYRYVKKGESIPIASMMEYEGFTIDGWYDDPESGNQICSDEEFYTPNSDIDLFAHWSKN